MIEPRRLGSAVILSLVDHNLKSMSPVGGVIPCSSDRVHHEFLLMQPTNQTDASRTMDSTSDSK